MRPAVVKVHRVITGLVFPCDAKSVIAKLGRTSTCVLEIDNLLSLTRVSKSSLKDCKRSETRCWVHLTLEWVSGSAKGRTGCEKNIE